MSSNIDPKDKILRTSSAIIHFDHQTRKINIDPTCEKLVTVKTHYTDGYFLYDEHAWSLDVISPAALVIVKNGLSRTTGISLAK